MASSIWAASAFWTTLSGGRSQLALHGTNKPVDGDGHALRLGGRRLSFAVRVPAERENGDGNGVSCVSVPSKAVRGGGGAAGRGIAAAGGAGGSGRSSAGATAADRLGDAVLPPSRRFQSEGGGETFRTHSREIRSPTPTWKSPRGLAGGWTDFTKARMTERWFRRPVGGREGRRRLRRDIRGAMGSGSRED